MPCRDYYDDHPDQYFKDVTEPQLKARIAFAESALCGLIRTIHALGLEQDLFDRVDWQDCGIKREALIKWFHAHDAHDREIRQQEHARKIAAARAKLTAEELDLLGLGK